MNEIKNMNKKESDGIDFLRATFKMGFINAVSDFKHGKMNDKTSIDYAVKRSLYHFKRKYEKMLLDTFVKGTSEYVKNNEIGFKM
jgi:hypothetical protein